MLNQVNVPMLRGVAIKRLQHVFCSLLVLGALSINVGGPNWPSTSDTCTFSVQLDGVGALEATFAPSGPVTFPPLPLSFVIVDRTEMRAIRTDGVVASGVFRRQARGGREGHRED